MFHLLAILLTFNTMVSSSEDFPRSIYVTWDIKRLCVGGDKALISTGVTLTYGYTVSGNNRSQIGLTIEKNNETRKVYYLSYPEESDGPMTSAEYHFEQLEHGGGDCNCVTIYINHTRLVTLKYIKVLTLTC